MSNETIQGKIIIFNEPAWKSRWKMMINKFVEFSRAQFCWELCHHLSEIEMRVEKFFKKVLKPQELLETHDETTNDVVDDLKTKRFL